MALAGRKRRFIIIGIVSILVVIVGIRLYMSKPFRKAAPHETQKVPVVVVPAVIGEIRHTLTFPGDLHAEEEAIVYSPVAARVTRYNYREGEEVPKNAVLVVLEREERWNKYKPLLVQAPITGRVAEIYLNAGEYATTQTPLCMLIGGTTIRVVLSVPDPDLRLIHPSMEALLSIPTIPGRAFPGTVTHVTPFIKSETRTGSAEVIFENAGGALLPGMYGDVDIVLDKEKDALTVPLAALLYEEGTNMPYVYIITDDHAVRKSVETGIVGTDTVQILSGINTGDRVVVIGKENLSDGTPAVVVDDK